MTAPDRPQLPPPLRMMLVGDDADTLEELELAEISADRYDGESIARLLPELMRRARAQRGVATNSGLRAYCPTLCVWLSSDEEGGPYRAEMRLPAASIATLAEAGASLDFDPYVESPPLAPEHIVGDGEAERLTISVTATDPVSGEALEVFRHVEDTYSAGSVDQACEPGLLRARSRLCSRRPFRKLRPYRLRVTALLEGRSTWIRPAMHLTYATFRLLSLSGAEFHFDPYVEQLDDPRYE